MSRQDEHAGELQPAIGNNRLTQRVEQNRKEPSKHFAEELDVPKSAVYDHLKATGKVKKLDKRVSYDLTDGNKKHRLKISHLLLSRQRYVFKFLITSNEELVVYNNRRSYLCSVAG